MQSTVRASGPLAEHPPITTIDALWAQMKERAGEREEVLLETFEPVAFDGAVLRVRLLGDAQTGGFAASRVNQLAALAQAAVGRTVRTLLDAPLPGANRAPRAAQVAAASDDPIRSHPLVRRVAELFDATVVRVDIAGTLPVAAPARDDAEEPSAGEENV